MFNRKKGRYAEKKPNKERTVISYEDMPLDDYEQEKTEISPQAVKKILVAVGIVLAASLAVFLFANRGKLSPENISVWWNYEVLGKTGSGYPVNLVGTEVKPGNFKVNDGRAAYASDTSFITLNSSGTEVGNVQLRYSKPVLESRDNRYLAYGLGETGYQILSFDKNLYSGTAKSVIYTGDICSNGRYCLVTEGDGFLTELYAFDSNNNRIFKYYFSEYYINRVALNSDGSGCVACGIASEGGALKTGVYVLDFGKQDPVSQYTIYDDVILDCCYIGSRRAALVGEYASYVVKAGDESYTTVGYDNRLLTNYCFSPESGSFALALSKSGDGRNCDLISYSDSGEKVTEIENDYGAEAFSVYKGTFAVLDGNTVYVYNKEGELKYTSPAGTGARGLALTSDTTAYVLSVNQIKLLDFNRPATSDSP